jgi:hypothetical protein
MRNWTADEVKAMADRLRRARLTAGFIHATEAVRKFGWNYSRYMNYENGGRAIPPKQAILFASAYGVSVDYIYFGIDDSLTQTKGAKQLYSLSVRRISLFGLEDVAELKRVACGLEPMQAITIPISDDEAVPKRSVFFGISDRSMFNANEPVSFEPGDKALIDLDASPMPSDFVLALVPEEECALFRLYREVGRAADGGLIIDLVPLNPNFRTVRITNPGDGQIIGVCRHLHRIFDLASTSRKSRFA